MHPKIQALKLIVKAWRKVMFEICPYNYDRECIFCGKDSLGDLYCGIIKTKAGKIPNKIETMLDRKIKCPKGKKVKRSREYG